MFVEGDGRSPWSRRYRDLIAGHVSDLGGSEALSEAQMSLVRRASAIECELEQMEGRLSQGETIDLDVFTRSASHLRRILETLGIDRASRERRLAELLGELGLASLAKSPAYTLSGGERRRAEITRALVISPRFILLDEPFAGIDPIAVTEIQKIVFHLRDRGIGVLITDHNVRETLRITDRAYIVHDGGIYRSGTPAALAADEDVRGIYLGTDFRLD